MVQKDARGDGCGLRDDGSTDAAGPPKEPRGFAMSINEGKRDGSHVRAPLSSSFIQVTIEENKPGHKVSKEQMETPTPKSAAPWDPMREVRQMAEGIVQQGSDQQPAGDKLSLYELIGRGGFGCVYRGRWRNMDVAVKVSIDVPQKYVVAE